MNHNGRKNSLYVLEVEDRGATLPLVDRGTPFGRNQNLVDAEDTTSEQLSLESSNEHQPTVFGSLYSSGVNKQFACESFYANEYGGPSFNQFNFEEWKRESRSTAPCMTSAWRVISFFMVVFVVPTILIAVPLYARYQLYYSRTLFLSDGDVIALHDTVSSFWCQSQQITSNGSFSAYFTEDRRTNPKNRRSSAMTGEVALQHDEAEQWGFYLVKGSSVQFSACARWPGASLIVVQGEENMRKCFYREVQTKDELKQINLLSKKPPTSNGEKNIPFLNSQTDLEKENHGGEIDQTVHNFEESLPSTSDVPPKDPALGKDTPVIRKKRGSFRISDSNNILDQSLNIGDIKKLRESEDLKPNLQDFVKKPISSKASIFLSAFNGTTDVSYGNSSYSSSEEFMSYCTSTIYHIELNPYINCTKMINSNKANSRDKWSFVANRSDYYFFLFSSDNSIEVNIIDVNIELDRALYDIRDASLMCANATSECSFPFSFWKKGGAVVDSFGDYERITRLEDLNTYEVTSYCQPRSIVYTILILLVPFVIILFAFR